MALLSTGMAGVVSGVGREGFVLVAVGTMDFAEAIVKTHVNRLLTKTGLHDWAGAVAVAYRTRLVAPNEPPHRVHGQFREGNGPQ
ncbi:hypothetical protein [Arthrobacter globiformis]|uniref:hypothetical protein n=1 Tax=Arthrobacter globiformis TaxID=1665 RepID=UPI001C0E9A18|nr:hypothetical protein [Arthrobacter globiformis]